MVVGGIIAACFAIAVWLGDKLLSSIEIWVEGLEIEDGRVAYATGLAGPEGLEPFRLHPVGQHPSRKDMAATRKESGEGDAASSSGHVRTDDIAHRDGGV